MVEHAGQILELRAAPSLVRTVVYCLQMSRAFEVLIQVLRCSELAVAKVALKSIAVPSVSSRPSLGMPFQEVVCKDAVAVALPHGAKDGLAVDTFCIWACTGLEVMRNAAGTCEAFLAKGA